MGQCSRHTFYQLVLIRLLCHPRDDIQGQQRLAICAYKISFLGSSQGGNGLQAELPSLEPRMYRVWSFFERS